MKRNHYYTLSLSEPWPGVEKTFFKKHPFSLLSSKSLPLGSVRGGHAILNFLSPYSTNATYEIWSKLAQLFLRRCSHSNRSSEWENQVIQKKLNGPYLLKVESPCPMIGCFNIGKLNIYMLILSLMRSGLEKKNKKEQSAYISYLDCSHSPSRILTTCFIKFHKWRV